MTGASLPAVLTEEELERLRLEMLYFGGRFILSEERACDLMLRGVYLDVAISSFMRSEVGEREWRRCRPCGYLSGRVEFMTSAKGEWYVIGMNEPRPYRLRAALPPDFHDE